MSYLTENPWPLAIVFFLAAGFFAWNAMRSGQKKIWRLAGVCAGLAVLPFVIDAIVETDNEQITESLEELAQGLIDNDVEKCLSFVAGAENASDAVRQAIEQGLQKIDVHDLRIKNVRIKSTGTEATCDFRANGTVDVRDVANNQHAATRWVLTWQKTGETWKVSQAKRLNPVTGDTIETMSAQ